VRRAGKFPERVGFAKCDSSAIRQAGFIVAMPRSSNGLFRFSQRIARRCVVSFPFALGQRFSPMPTRIGKPINSESLNLKPDVHRDHQ